MQKIIRMNIGLALAFLLLAVVDVATYVFLPPAPKINPITTEIRTEVTSIQNIEQLRKVALSIINANDLAQRTSMSAFDLVKSGLRLNIFIYLAAFVILLFNTIRIQKLMVSLSTNSQSTPTYAKDL